MAQQENAGNSNRPESAEQRALFGRPNQREAVAAGMEKRAAAFSDSIG